MTVTLVYGDHWDAMYIDGELAVDAHSLQARWVIKELLGKNPTSLEEFHVDGDWLNKRGCYPKSLAEVPLQAAH